MKKWFHLRAGLCAAALLAGSNAFAATNLLFILDASNSMWGKVDNTTKIETAKATLTSLASDLPSETGLGLMVYGHREKGDCQDVELVLPVGRASARALATALDEITPKGKTPMAYSIERSAAAFAGQETGNNNVVLISDGIETCEGDPCTAAGKLASANIGVRVHVVGFDIAEKDRAQLECIAEQGKGRYFAAKSTKGFADAVVQATKVAQTAPEQQPEPEPKAEPPAKPTWTTVFEDQFDGDDLGAHWSVTNPNTNAYVVENGELLLLSTNKGRFEDENIENMMVLDKPLPKGDWRMTAKFKVEFGTTEALAFMGLYKDKANRLLTRLYTTTFDGWGKANVEFTSSKHSNGKLTTSSETHRLGRAKSLLALTQGLPEAVFVQLEKQGRSYIGRVRLGDSAEAKWRNLSKLTSLRPLGKPVIGLQKGPGSGEDLMYLDWVRMETLSSEKAAAPAAQKKTK